MKNEVVKKVWATADGDSFIAYMARVSNPGNQDNPDSEKLIKYLVKHGHWSPFEMVNLTVEINTPRDIGRQILRHRSFTFQEFSQRYADVTKLADEMIERECRMQDVKNKQSSLVSSDVVLNTKWSIVQSKLWATALVNYKDALALGIAKEQARALLPEGLTPTRMYMNGTLRSWIHFLKARLYIGAQKEIREIAKEVEKIIQVEFPQSYNAIKDYIHETV